MSSPTHIAMPLTDDDARELQDELLERLAIAISGTATRFLCTRPERHDERAHLVGLLTDLICEGKANPAVVQRAVAIEESLFTTDDYARERLALDDVTREPPCPRCGGQGHDARECLIQELVCEIEGHLRLHGPTSVDALQAHLERSLGAPREAAAEACARWARSDQ